MVKCPRARSPTRVQDIRSEEASEEHCREQRGVDRLVCLDEQLFRRQEQQRGDAEGKDGSEQRRWGGAENDDRADGTNDQSERK